MEDGMFKDQESYDRGAKAGFGGGARGSEEAGFNYLDETGFEPGK
jgi:hypothetical protein